MDPIWPRYFSNGWGKPWFIYLEIFVHLKIHQLQGWNFTNSLPPRTNGWNLKMMVSNRNLLFQGFIFRFHVSFPGCSGFHGRIILEESFTGLCDGQLVEIFKLPKDDLSPNIPQMGSSNQIHAKVKMLMQVPDFSRKRCFFLVLKNGTRWVFKGVWCWCFWPLSPSKGEKVSSLMNWWQVAPQQDINEHLGTCSGLWTKTQTS